MKRFHQLFGISVVIVFLLTGQYMDNYLGHLEGMPDGPKMLYRSRHIYILLAGLLNIGIGAYFTYHVERWRRVLQFSALSLIAHRHVLIHRGILLRAQAGGPGNSLSQRGVYLISLGALFHLFSALGRRKHETDPAL